MKKTKKPAWAKESLINAIMRTGYYDSESEAVSELESAFENLMYDTDGYLPSMRNITNCMNEAGLDLDHIESFLEGYNEYCKENPNDCEDMEDIEDIERSLTELFAVS